MSATEHDGPTEFKPGETFDYVHVCDTHASTRPILTSGLVTCTAIGFSDTEGNNYLIHGSNVHPGPGHPDHVEDDVVDYLKENPDIEINPGGVHVVMGMGGTEKYTLDEYLEANHPAVPVTRSNYNGHMIFRHRTRPIDHYVGIDDGKLIVRNPIRKESHRKIQDSVGVAPEYRRAATFKIEEKDLT